MLIGTEDKKVESGSCTTSQPQKTPSARQASTKAPEEHAEYEYKERLLLDIV